jgi:hypothetical protein
MMSAVGAMQSAWHDKPNRTGSIAARPCKKRKDGAPTVPERETKSETVRMGHPPPGLNIMNLNPLPGNECLDTERDCKTFRLHGDNATHTASEGCIILPPNRINIPLNDTIWVEP